MIWVSQGLCERCKNNFLSINSALFVGITFYHLTALLLVLFVLSQRTLALSPLPIKRNSIAATRDSEISLIAITSFHVLTRAAERMKSS
jgi:hypothetical protein